MTYYNMNLKFLMAVILLLMLFPTGQLMAQQQTTPVFVATVKKDAMVDEIEALGTLQANENVNLTSTVTERIISINFTDNQRVEIGDVLIEMDAAEEEAELVEEQSRRDEAQRQVNRLRPLVQRGAASQSALDEQEKELSSSKARLKAIRSRINERKITAPFDGVVGIRNISVGALTQPETILTTIDDDSVMKLDFAVPEIFLSSLKKGITIKAKAAAFPDEIFQGEISSIDSRIDPITRAVKIRAILDNPNGILKAGMLMRVEIANNPRQTLIIPEEAIITKGDKNTVLVVVENDGTTTAEQQVVAIGARRLGEVEIIEGLKEGQQVITHGTLRVRPGSEISIQATEKNNETLTELLNQNNDGNGEQK